MKCVFVDKNDCGYRRSMVGSEESKDVACSLCEQSEFYPTAAAAVPGPEVEWTSEDGRSNSSDLYLRIVADVADCIRSIRVGDDPISEARTIVSRIAHEWKLVPVPISEPPVTKGTT